jgi:hypothetical protein
MSQGVEVETADRLTIVNSNRTTADVCISWRRAMTAFQMHADEWLAQLEDLA